MVLQTLAAVIARKMGWVRRSFPNLLRSVVGSVLFSSAFVCDMEAKASQVLLNSYPLVTVSRNFVRTVSVFPSTNPRVKPGLMLFKLHITG